MGAAWQTMTRFTGVLTSLFLALTAFNWQAPCLLAAQAGTEEKPCPISGKTAPKDKDGDDDPVGSAPAEPSVENGKPVQDGSAADGAVKKSSDHPFPTVAPGWHEGKDSVHFRAAP